MLNKTDSFAHHLRSQGYRLTPQRVAVLRILEESGKHLSPVEVYQQAQEALPGITETTVYRTLDFLVKQGLALPAHIGNGQYVYEYARRNHHHLICRDCGDMLEINHEALQALYRQFQESTGYQIETIHLTFFGQCPRCQKK